MSNRAIIGTAVAVGAGYYLYQRQVQLKQQQAGQIPVSPIVHDQDTFELKGAKAGAKIDDISDDVKDKVSQYKTDADYKFQNIASQVESKKAGMADWAVDKLDRAKSNLEESRDKYQETTDNLKGNLDEYKNKDKPNAVVQAINNTKEAISTDIGNIKEGFIDDLKSVKSAIVGTTSEVHDHVVENVNELSDKSARKVDEAKEHFSQAASSGKRAVNQAAAEAKDTSNNILNWGFNKAEKVRAQAINEYDEANKKYQGLEKQYNESKKGLFGKGDPELKKQLDEAKSYVSDAKARVDQATREFTEKTAKNFNDMADQMHANDEELKRKGFLTWLRGKTDSQVEDPDVVANDSVRGFGETAEWLGREELDEKKRNQQAGPSEAQQRLERLRKIKEEGWFNQQAKDGKEAVKDVGKTVEGWGESASNKAKEDYDDLLKWKESARQGYQESAAAARDSAQQAVDSAKKQLEETRAELNKQTKHWWQFGAEKNEELQKAAKAKYDAAEKEYQSAVGTLNDWTDKASGKFWSSADDALHTARNAAGSVHETTIKGIDKAQDYVQDKK